MAARQRLKLVSEDRVPTTSDIDPRFAQCRSVGHEWRHLGLVTDDDERHPFGADTGEIMYRSQCSECTTIRTRFVTRSGMIPRSPRYEYPEGYSRHGDDRLSTFEWRSSWVTILLDDFEQQTSKRRTRKAR